jgi:hypothetical protein
MTDAQIHATFIMAVIAGSGIATAKQPWRGIIHLVLWLLYFNYQFEWIKL